MTPDKLLTRRQLEIYRALGKGLSVAEIAGEVKLSAATVYNHLGAIKCRMNARNIASLTREAVLWVEGRKS